MATGGCMGHRDRHSASLEGLSALYQAKKKEIHWSLCATVQRYSPVSQWQRQRYECLLIKVRRWGEESECRTTRASYAGGFILNEETSGFTVARHHPSIARECQQ